MIFFAIVNPYIINLGNDGSRPYLKIGLVESSSSFFQKSSVRTGTSGRRAQRAARVVSGRGKGRGLGRE